MDMIVFKDDEIPALRKSLKKLNSESYQQFIEYIDVNTKSIETYRRSLKQFFKYLAANSISSPTRSDVLDYKEYLKSKLKAPTVQLYMASVRIFFKWTLQEGLYPNIADGIKGAKIGREYKKDALSKQQLADILNTIDKNTDRGIRDYALLLTMLVGGLRTIEVNRSNIEDFRNLGNGTVLYIQGKGKDEKSEYIKIPVQVEKAIRMYLQIRTNKSDKDPLFASQSNNNINGRMTTRSISQIVKDCFKKAGYNDSRLTAHSIRHTSATLNLLNGGTLEETQQLMRHGNINTTMIYAHHLERANNRSEERIANALFSD